MCDIIERLDREKYEPLFICPKWGPVCERLVELGIEVYTLENKGLIFLIYLMKKKKISMVHANTFYAYQGVLAAIFTGIPVLWHIHEDPRTSIDFRFISILAHLLPVRVATVSRAMKDALNLGDKCSVVYNGVDLKKFSVETNCTLKQKFGTDIIVGQIGTIEPRKGTEFFIKAAPMVLKKFPQAKFLIVGSPLPSQERYFEKMKNLVCEMGLEKNIVFTGFERHIQEKLKGMDMVVLASLREPFSRVLLEAMACGKPVVATAVGGTPEMVINGATGILVPPADPLALANAIINILSDREMAKKMGMEGRKRVEEEFSIERYVRNIERIYEEILQ